MTTSDMIALGALLVSLLSAVYANRAVAVAKRAHDATLHWQQRPLRLQVFQAMWQFSQYCSTYFTRFRLNDVNGTRDLVSRIESFRWQLTQHGPLEMPEVEMLQRQMVAAAWNMQRLIDRIAGGHAESMDQQFETAEDHLHSLIDWFASARDGLSTTFGQYLAAEPGNSEMARDGA